MTKNLGKYTPVLTFWKEYCQCIVSQKHIFRAAQLLRWQFCVLIFEFTFSKKQVFIFINHILYFHAFV